jgi:hypothetical protein
MKTVAIVSRKWNNPAIEAFVTSTEIGGVMDIQDVLASMVEEIGNPTMLLTKKQLLSKLQLAWEVVEKEIKDATRHV